jgi:hypothetical protein
MPRRSSSWYCAPNTAVLDESLFLVDEASSNRGVHTVDPVGTDALSVIGLTAPLTVWHGLRRESDNPKQSKKILPNPSSRFVPCAVPARGEILLYPFDVPRLCRFAIAVDVGAIGLSQ